MEKPDFEKWLIKEFKYWKVYLNINQCYLGRLYLWAKREDALDFMEMTFEEREEFFKIGNLIKNALHKLFKPDLINYAALGNIDKHLHMHIIPRYSSSRIFYKFTFNDEKWGQNYAPYNKDFKLPEEVLENIRVSIKNKL